MVFILNNGIRMHLKLVGAKISLGVMLIEQELHLRRVIFNSIFLIKGKCRILEITVTKSFKILFDKLMTKQAAIH